MNVRLRIRKKTKHVSVQPNIARLSTFSLNIKQRYYHHSCFKDEAVEAQRGYITCLRAQSLQVEMPRCERYERRQLSVELML